MARCTSCPFDHDLDFIPLHTQHLLHRLEYAIALIERTSIAMTDFTTATTDAINELGTLAEELIAALKATPTPDPAVQDAADRLEAAVTAAKSSDPTPAPSDPVPAPAVTDPVASTGDAPAAGSVAPIPDTTPTAAPPSDGTAPAA